MSQFICSYYKKENGEIPVREFIDSLQPRSQRRFFFVVKLLEEFGPKLPQPHAKYIREGVFELRFSGHEGAIRVLYFFHGQQQIVLTSGFIKKTNKIPGKQKELAIERRRLFLNESRKS